MKIQQKIESFVQKYKLLLYGNTVYLKSVILQRYTLPKKCISAEVQFLIFNFQLSIFH